LSYEYPSLCQRCIWQTRPTMLTGYSIEGKCERCGHYGDLALVKAASEKPRFGEDQR